MRTRIIASIIVTAACLAPVGARAAVSQVAVPPPQGSEVVTLDPAAFSTDIDNPFLPLRPGSRWVYRERGAGSPEQRVEVTVTSRVRMVAGIRARVVHDVVTAGGRRVEDTYDWYAQDRAGNVWYLGEDTREYRRGKVVSRAGSWEAGVRGAQPGIAMPAAPVPGLAYRQEYFKGEAEDHARVLSTDEQVQTPRGLFRGALLTKDLTPLQPRLVEYKVYARGVGLVLAVAVSGGSDREELLSYRPGRAG